MKNISDKFLRNKIENEKNDIYMEIENAKIKKANLLLDMGIMIYEKIRSEIIIDDSFDNICNEILEIDKLIYNNNLRIKTLEEKSQEIVCECGSVINSENRFCGTCGKKVEIEEDYLTECTRCDSLNEEDSVYCACCGIKL